MTTGVTDEPALAMPSIPVSWGELIDKITILEIKRDRIVAAEARANVLREHDLLCAIAGAVIDRPELQAPLAGLRRVNAALWEIEDAIRHHEARGDFGDEFVRLARAVYQTNDERAALKRDINLHLQSTLIEEKSYADTGAASG